MFDEPKISTSPSPPPSPNSKPEPPKSPAPPPEPPPPPPPQIPQEGPKTPPAEEPEDIFAETIEEKIKTPPSTKSQPSPSEGPLGPMVAEAGFLSKNKKWIIIGVVALVVMVVIIFVVLSLFGGETEKKPISKPAAIETPTTQPVSSEAPGENVNVNTAPEPPIDTDRDGLSNIAENQLGTDPKRPDTDNDGLTDREEVEVYKTDPINPDTDGDGYLDGEEVKNGYNPLGPGELINIQEELNKLK